MTYSSAIEFIRNPQLLNRSTIPVIEDAIAHYPFHQTLYLLLLQNLYKVHDPRFSSMLRRYAIMIADRSVLFEMVERQNYNIPIQKMEDEDTANVFGDRTLQLIDNFLKEIPDSRSNSGAESVSSDGLPDYSVYLENLPDIDADSEANVDAGLPAVRTGLSVQNTEMSPAAETPLEDEFTVKAIRQQLAEDADHSLDESADEAPDSEYFTETMAGIYIKQQKYGQALEIIRAISAANPKKSVYFADQIRYLELLTRLKHEDKQK